MVISVKTSKVKYVVIKKVLAPSVFKKTLDPLRDAVIYVLAEFVR